MKKFVFLILVVFTFFSCAEQKPKHSIYGKWISKDSAKMKIVFSDDNKCKLTIFGENGEVLYSSVYHFEIVDDSSVKIILIGYETYQLKVNAKIESDETLYIQCLHSKDSEGRTIIDLPEFCPSYFKKAEK